MFRKLVAWIKAQCKLVPEPPRGQRDVGVLYEQSLGIPLAVSMPPLEEHRTSRSVMTAPKSKAPPPPAPPTTRPANPYRERRRDSDSGSDLLTGVLIGEALGAFDSSPSTPSDPSPSSDSGFSGGGGESGGGGASGDW